MANEIPEIKLSADSEEKLINLLEDQIVLGEDFRGSSDWDDLHDFYWRAYFSEPDFPTKDTPWPGASNLFNPITHVMTEGVIAQEFDAMLSNDPTVKVVALEDANSEYAEMLSRYYGEFYWKNICPIRTFGGDWLMDNTVDGTSAVKVRAEKQYEVLREQTVVEDPIFEQINMPGIGMMPSAVGSDYRVVERSVIRESTEVRPETVDLSKLYMAPDSGPSLQWPECRWYYQEQDLTWDDMLARKRFGYKGIDDDLKKLLSDRDLSSKESLIREREGTSDTVVEPTIKVTEHYMRWPLGGVYSLYREDSKEPEEIKQENGAEDGYWEEIIVTYVPEARKILRIKPLSSIYPDGKRPHVLGHYTRIPRYIYGIGIPSKLRHINRALNTFGNQGIDWGTLQNMPWYFYNPASMNVMPDLKALRPGQGVPTLDPRGVNIPRLQGDPNFFLSREQQLQIQAERISAISDVQLGRNPSTPNAPRTKGGMAMQLMQGNIAFSRLVSVHAEAWLELMRKIHSVKRRTAPRQTRFTVTEGSKGQQMSMPREAFEMNIDFQFVLNPNRQQEQQTNMQLFQLMAAIPYIAQQPEAVRQLAREVYESMGKKNFNRIWPEQMVAPIQGPPPEQMSGPSGAAPQPSMPPVPGAGMGSPNAESGPPAQMIQGNIGG